MNQTERLEESNQLLRQQNEQLKNQLTANSLISEISKVMLASSNLQNVFKTMMLGIQETLNFGRLILFKVNSKDFCLKPLLWNGIADEMAARITVPLSFPEGGEIADAVFLNQHIIADQPDRTTGPMAPLASRGYLVLPLVEKISKKCCQFRNCQHKKCPAYESYNSFCWSTPGSGQMEQNRTKDDKRRNCTACPLFKANHLLWMDKPGASELVTGEDMIILTTLANQAGIIINNFQNNEKLELTNNELIGTNIEIKKIHKELNLAQIKINKDLSQARIIQHNLMPETFPQDSRFSIAASYIPTAKVG